MDCFLDNQLLIDWLTQYGGLALFVLLILGILALPIPEETLMVVAGVLIKNGTLTVYPTLLAAYAGSMCGITLSYLLGKTAGAYLIERFGEKWWIGKHFQQAQQWFDRFGKWALFIGYFIPGVRHFTGFSAGMVKMTYRKFSIFAYGGAVVWVSLFISIGYFFGNYCFSLLEELDFDLNVLIAIAIAVLAIYFFIKKALTKR